MVCGQSPWMALAFSLLASPATKKLPSCREFPTGFFGDCFKLRPQGFTGIHMFRKGHWELSLNYPPGNQHEPYMTLPEGYPN